MSTCTSTQASRTTPVFRSYLAQTLHDECVSELTERTNLYAQPWFLCASEYAHRDILGFYTDFPKIAQERFKIMQSTEAIEVLKGNLEILPQFKGLIPAFEAEIAIILEENSQYHFSFRDKQKLVVDERRKVEYAEEHDLFVKKLIHDCDVAPIKLEDLLAQPLLYELFGKEESASTYYSDQPLASGHLVSVIPNIISTVKVTYDNLQILKKFAFLTPLSRALIADVLRTEVETFPWESISELYLYVHDLVTGDSEPDPDFPPQYKT